MRAHVCVPAAQTESHVEGNPRLPIHLLPQHHNNSLRCTTCWMASPKCHSIMHASLGLPISRQVFHSRSFAGLPGARHGRATGFPLFIRAHQMACLFLSALPLNVSLFPHTAVASTNPIYSESTTPGAELTPTVSTSNTLRPGITFTYNSSHIDGLIHAHQHRIAPAHQWFDLTPILSKLAHCPTCHKPENLVHRLRFGCLPIHRSLRCITPCWSPMSQNHPCSVQLHVHEHHSANSGGCFTHHRA